MNGYPGPPQHNGRVMMNGAIPPHQHPMDQARHNINNNVHGPPSELDSHYSNPYTDQQHNNFGHNGANANNNKMAVHRPRLNRKNAQEDKPKSSLTTNFDPMKDRHMWAMWRTAVNGRIVDQVRKNEQFKQDALLPPDEFSSVAGESDGRVSASTYGKDLASVPPLSRFIRLNQKSKNIAQGLMNEGQGKLETTQFIYYGLPRVTVNTGHPNRYMNKDDKYSFDNNPNINGIRNGRDVMANGQGNTNFYTGEHPVQDY